MRGASRAGKNRSWDCEELQSLRKERNTVTTAVRRSQISKDIQRITRRRLREHKTKAAQICLEAFQQLEVLEKTHMYPIKKKHTTGPNYEECAQLLQQVYQSDTNVMYSSKCSIPPFSISEIQSTVKSMRKKRSADSSGVLLEMFLYGGDEVLQSLQSCLNEILDTGEILTSWYETFFVLLYKGGKVEDANNWRPIALLSITYKILARLVYFRIRDELEKHQSHDQFSFRRKNQRMKYCS